MFEWFVKKLCKDNRGFTLIELIVVIAILGILAAIAVPKLGKSRINAGIAAHNANVRTLESAATLFVADGNKIPDVGEEWSGINTQKWVEYVQQWPEVPKSLIGKTFETTEVKMVEKGEGDEKKNVEEVVTVKFDDNIKYNVKIDKNGSITVTPGKITDKESTN